MNWVRECNLRADLFLSINGNGGGELCSTCCARAPSVRRHKIVYLYEYRNQQLPERHASQLDGVPQAPWISHCRRVVGGIPINRRFLMTHPLPEKYKSGGGRHRCLTKIDGLPIVRCQDLPTCSLLFRTEEGLRMHCSQKHEEISTKEFRAL